MTLDQIITKYPKLQFMKSSAFLALPLEKQQYLAGCVEDALFWIEWERGPHVTDGFKFLASAYGLMKAEKSAQEKGLTGKEKATFLKPHEELYTEFCPHFGTDSIIPK